MRVVSIIQAKRVQLFWQNNRGLSMANRRKSALGFPGFLCFPGFPVGNERFFRKTEQIPRPKLTDRHSSLFAQRFVRLPARLLACYFSDLPAIFLT